MHTEEVEGNVYFPEASLKREYFRPSSTTSTCPWKGQARYMSLLIDGQDNRMPPGTTPIPSLRRARSRATSRSGAASKWRRRPGVLRELTAQLRVYGEPIRAAAGVMSVLDLIFAKARFAIEFDCCVPKFGDRIHIENARHRF